MLNVMEDSWGDFGSPVSIHALLDPRQGDGRSGRVHYFFSKKANQWHGGNFEPTSQTYSYFQGIIDHFIHDVEQIGW